MWKNCPKSQQAVRWFGLARSATLAAGIGLVMLSPGPSAALSPTDNNPKNPQSQSFGPDKPQSIADLIRLARADSAKSDLSPGAQKKSIIDVRTTLPEERAHNSAFDTYIRPLTDLRVSASDKRNIIDAAKAIKAKQPGDVAKFRAQVSDVAGRKLIDWLRLRAGFGTANEYANFLNQNPSWPNRWLIQQRLEEAWFKNGGEAQTIQSYFAKNKPETGIGFGVWSTAVSQTGGRTKAVALAKQGWREEDIPADFERAYVNRFSKILTTADHKYRIDRLMLNAPRWRSQKKAKAKEIRRLIPLLPAVEQKRAKARLSVFLGNKSGAGVLGKTNTSNGTDWGRVFHKIQVLRRKKQYDTAAKLILSAPLTDKDKIANPDAWWKERRRHAVAALRRNKPKLAYRLVRVAGDLSDNPRKQQAFTAGWIALRYLKDVKAGLAHMKVMKAAADGPLSRAKSTYWVGRAYEQAGDKSSAMVEYREAAKGIDTFHGQLARLKVNPSDRNIPLKAPARPTKAELKRFLSNDAVRAAVIANKIGLRRAYTRPFFAHLRSVMPTEAEVALILHLTRAVGDTQMSVRMAKKAIGSGYNVLYYSYPVTGFPKFKPLGKTAETAFLLSITRQESEFEPTTRSGAGARGLMQVMPITARHVCRDYKLKCNISRLMTDTAYNATIASAYITDRMSEFRGSYILGLAGYNAGPGRARQWIKQFGDPRDPSIDPIDWIERIPFQETRRYVTKVLSSIQIYRARLGKNKPEQLDLDLVRARRSTRAAN